MDEDKLDNLFIQFHDELNMKSGSGEFYNTLGAGFVFGNNVMTSKSISKMECPYNNLKKTTAKCLVIKDQYDYLSFGVTKQYRDLIPNSKMITINNIGHSIEFQFESEIFENIESFIKTGNTIKTPYTGSTSPWEE